MTERREPGGAKPRGPAPAGPLLPDALQPPARLRKPLLVEVFAHARECYPEECCGLLLGRAGGVPERVVRCTNVQDQRYSAGESELGARHAFWIDESELFATLRESEQRGDEIHVVYHSHVDAPAYLSDADVRGALGPDGEPLYPGTAQLVISVCDGSVREAAWFEWEPEQHRFVGRVLGEGS